MRSQQWALDKISFESAWSVTRGQGVKVAIVDSGVEADHQDLPARCCRARTTSSPAGDGDTDPNGHGTHVAGIIAAHVNNGLGIAGAAPDVQDPSGPRARRDTAAASPRTSPRASSGPPITARG